MSQPRKRKSSKVEQPVTFDTVRAIARALPCVVECTSYGTPAFRVGGNLFVRQHQDGESLVVRIDFADRAMRMKTVPQTYSITDHYRDHPWMLVRLATVDADDLRELLGDAWRLRAPKRLLAAGDASAKRKTAQNAPPRKPRPGRPQE